jgi:hypothetical protein
MERVIRKALVITRMMAIAANINPLIVQAFVSRIWLIGAYPALRSDATG